MPMSSSPVRPLPHSLTTAGMIHFGSSVTSVAAETEKAATAPEPEPEPVAIADDARAVLGTDSAAAAPTSPAAQNTALPSAAPVAEWTIEQVCQWAASIGLPDTPCVRNLRTGRVDGEALLEIESDEMRDELQFPIGERKRLLRHVAQLRESMDTTAKE